MKNKSFSFKSRNFCVMKYSILIALTFFLSTSCSSPTAIKFEPTDFKLEGFSWEPESYRFSKDIVEKVIPEKGNAYAAWDYAYIGDIKKMHEAWDTDYNDSDSISTEAINNFKNYLPINAVDHIVEQAINTNVTIINEGHHMPQHRVFTATLLQKMYDTGYRHFGMEGYFTSHKSDSTLVADHYPSLTHGYYMRDPQFGDMVRQALKIGYKIFGYESQGHENGKEREMNQAKNIQDYMYNNPNGKYLLHCGFDHNLEGELGGKWEKAMAARLTEYTAIDPLTINQTYFSERSKKSNENPYYQLTSVSEPSIFQDKKGKTFNGARPGKGWQDLYVFHPRTQKTSRAQWLNANNKKTYEIPLTGIELPKPWLVFAYPEGEKLGTAVPYDVQEVSEDKVHLVLAPGKYNVVVMDTTKTAVKGEFDTSK